MGNAKEHIHHVATGVNFIAVGTAIAAVAATAVGGAIGAAASVVAATTTAAGVAGVASIFALVGAAATKPDEHFVPAETQRTCRRIGAGLLAAFTIACGGGVGYAVSQKIDETNDNHAASTSPTPLHRDFAVQVSGTDNEDCIVVVPANKGPVRTESASCSVKELGLSVK